MIAREAKRHKLLCRSASPPHCHTVCWDAPKVPLVAFQIRFHVKMLRITSVELFCISNFAFSQISHDIYVIWDNAKWQSHSVLGGLLNVMTPGGHVPACKISVFAENSWAGSEKSSLACASPLFSSKVNRRVLIKMFGHRELTGPSLIWSLLRVSY